MKRRRLTLVGTALFLVAATPAAAAGKWWAGGGIGMGFGDVRFADLSGIVGYDITPRWSAGTRVSYRNTTVEQSGRDVTTSDYGAGVFATFGVKGPFFLQAEYEYLNYEFVDFDASSERDDFESVLLGGGFSHALTPNSTLFFAALYNLSYDDSDEPSPYDDPYVIRFGIGFHF